MEALTYKEPWSYNRHATKKKHIKYRVNENGCWLCISHTLDRDGYAKITRNKKEMRLHRYVYELEKGEIPDGHVVMHTCDIPTCFNPDHLTTGTIGDNVRDALSKGRKVLGRGDGGKFVFKPTNK